MVEYIKKEDALSFPFANGQYDHKNADEHFINGCETYREWLVQIPAADVRPVVLCRDCKHKGWVQEPEHGKSVDYCRLIERCVDKQFFCAAGERKTDCGADMR